MAGFAAGLAGALVVVDALPGFFPAGVFACFAAVVPTTAAAAPVTATAAAAAATVPVDSEPTVAPVSDTGLSTCLISAGPLLLFVSTWKSIKICIYPFFALDMF